MVTFSNHNKFDHFRSHLGAVKFSRIIFFCIFNRFSCSIEFSTNKNRKENSHQTTNLERVKFDQIQLNLKFRRAGKFSLIFFSNLIKPGNLTSKKLSNYLNINSTTFIWINKYDRFWLIYIFQKIWKFVINYLNICTHQEKKYKKCNNNIRYM